MEIEKINKLTSVAYILSNRLNNISLVLNHNLDTIVNNLKNISSLDDHIFRIFEQIHLTDKMLGFLSAIERTISFSFRETPNLELITLNDLHQIHQYLTRIYGRSQLIGLTDSYTVKSLEGTKLVAAYLGTTITFILKLPILNPIPSLYYRFYPIPNHQQIILVPPAMFVLQFDHTTFWTDEDCPAVSEFRLCATPPKEDDQCNLNKIDSCPSAKTVTPFSIVHTLVNQQLLCLFSTPTTVHEDCNGLLTKNLASGSVLLDSSCRLLIGSMIYDHTRPTFNLSIPAMPLLNLSTVHLVDFQIQHLMSPLDLTRDLKQIDAAPLQTVIHYTSTGLSLLLLFALLMIIFTFRHRIISLLCHPRQIIEVIPVPTRTPEA